MSKDTAGSGTPDPQGGTEGDQVKEVVETKEQKSVSFDDHKLALDDMMRFKRELKAANENAASLEAKLGAAEDQKLAEEQDQAKKADEYKRRWEEERTRNDNFQSSFTTSQKYNAVYAVAMKEGIRKEAVADLELQSFDDVDVESTDQGRFLVNGAEDFVDKLKLSKPHWFNDKKVPTFNSGGGTARPNAPQELTADYMVRLEKTNYPEYKRLFYKFKEQLAQNKQGG